MMTKLSRLGAMAVLGLGMAFQASAAEVFEVTPSAVAGAQGPFNADSINGSSSTLVTLDTVANTGTGAGWLSFSAFTLGGSTVLGTGIDNDYQFWAEFSYDLVTQDPADTIGPGVDLFVQNMVVTLHAAPGTDVTFAPTSLNDFVTPTVDTTGAATVHDIGTATLISGVVEPTSQGGNAFNANFAYQNSPFGDTFFTSPVPFYDLAFNEFNNTSTQIAVDGDLVRIIQTGSVDFNAAAVPEPATLALMGLGLLGLGAASMRRRRTF